MNSIRIYILEDEIITQELLKETLEVLGYKVCGMATNAEIALKEIEELQPDIAILDIRVEGLETGIWLGNQLEIPFIYLTAFNDVETIKKAINTKPTSYLVKPFNNNELFIAVELAISKIKKTAQIIVKDRDKNIKILEEDIMFAKKEDHYLALHLVDSKRLIRASIHDFLKQVNSSSFLQVHRSYVVNKNYISAFNSKEITINNYKIPLSKTYVKEVFDEIS
ncbi:LytR/AlgR family response regulator transcription factor [Polaribacter sp. IC073]|uniref:LytR/AlgR family response regulator transcription factor n=1 Tax=Polaribacter sp. IC073 TaxID=2508540 RepID=UPI0011BDB122|nr:LytTR family transcriptional regulator DNA-binding domain-containing protein [Polaribacter sp. IC073]TXD47864.1 response regulator transcription factor [Polaribacter sp. IC073]